MTYTKWSDKTTEQKKTASKATQKYTGKAYDRVVLTMPKGKRDSIKAKAKLADESMNAYILGAIYQRMEREGLQ